MAHIAQLRYLRYTKLGRPLVRFPIYLSCDLLCCVFPTATLSTGTLLLVICSFFVIFWVLFWERLVVWAVFLFCFLDSIYFFIFSRYYLHYLVFFVLNCLISFVVLNYFLLGHCCLGKYFFLCCCCFFFLDNSFLFCCHRVRHFFICYIYFVVGCSRILVDCGCSYSMFDVVIILSFLFL